MSLVEAPKPRIEIPQLVFPTESPEFDRGLDTAIAQGWSVLPCFSSSTNTHLVNTEIGETLGVGFRSAFGPSSYKKFLDRMPITAQLSTEYERLLSRNAARYPTLKDAPIKRCDIFEYNKDTDFWRHQDPIKYGPIIFSLTTQGSCEVTVYPVDREPVRFTVKAGDLWILRGGGFDLPYLEHELTATLTEENRIAVVMNGLIGVKGDPVDL